MRPSFDALLAGASSLAALLQVPEDQWFDRKSARADERALAKTLIAMANAEGGLVVVGMHDGQIEGVAPAHANRLRAVPLTFANPALPVQVGQVRGQLGDVLLFEVAPSEGLHEDNRGTAYLRVGDGDLTLGFEERRELSYAKGVVIHDGTLVSGASWQDLDEEAILEYVESVGGSDPGRVLAARGMTRESGVTAAGVVMLGSEPSVFKPGAWMRILRVHGTERLTGQWQNIVSDTRVDGHVPRLAREGFKAAMEVVPKRRALSRDGQFVWQPMVPPDALREAIVNALIHRSYSIEGDHVRVWCYDDRIEVESPGRFPDPRMARDLSRSGRRARNPRIARMCSDLGIGQELGEGLRRMEALMRGAGLAPPLIELLGETTRVTLSLESQDVADEHLLIIEALRRGGALRTGEIQDLVGVSRPTIRRRLLELEAGGRIVRLGLSAQDPHARWALADSAPL